MVNLVHLQHDRLNHIVDDQLEIRVPQPVSHVALASRKHVVHHDHLVACDHQTIDQMTADETRTTRDENAHALAVRKNFHFREDGLRRCLGQCLRWASIKNLTANFMRYNFFDL